MGKSFKKLMVAGLVAPNSYTLMHSESCPDAQLNDILQVH